MMRKTVNIIIILAVLAVGFMLYKNTKQFDLPEGDTVPVERNIATDTGNSNKAAPSERKILETDGVKHSIPLNEILDGGPGKDGIPSIDNPKFTDTDEADEFLDDSAIGLGLEIEGDIRFYPYMIMVWHEIANDVVGGVPVAVTYCPLCATAIVFDRTQGGKVLEFGVSGKLWQSNLLMYDRAENEDDESLWSQVLGEAVLGKQTGTKLTGVRSDTLSYGEWKRAHPDTKVLSRDTGASWTYGKDPYGSYYTDAGTIFPTANSDDTRLHEKEVVLGIKVGGVSKAYVKDDIPVGGMIDEVAGRTVTIDRNENGEILMSVTGSVANGELTDTVELSYIPAFWFSWISVHPDTELYNAQSN